MNKEQCKLVLAGALGNVLEWYDFAVYGYFAAIIGMHFFPSDDPATSLIASFGAFAAGYLVRPAGSVLFGHIGDRYGHKAALTSSVMMMAVPTFCIGLLPDFQSIGFLAPILLVALRMAQGISVGGEYTTSITFLAENAEVKRRGFFASFSSIGSTSGILLGSGSCALITLLLGADAVEAWGWRIPFLSGVAIGLIGLYLRRQLMDSAPPKQPPRFPLEECLRDHWRELLRLGAVVVGIALSFYLVFIYVATWLQQVAHVTQSRALDINTFNMVVLVVMVPFAAMLSDRIGRRPVLIAGYGGIVLFSYPLFWLMHQGSTTAILLGQLGFVLLIGTAGGALPALLAEISPARVRVTLMSLAYNVVLGIVGGTAPMVAAYLVSRTGDDLSPAIYLAAGTLISLIAVIRLKETAGSDLNATGDPAPPVKGRLKTGVPSIS